MREHFYKVVKFMSFVCVRGLKVCTSAWTDLINLDQKSEANSIKTTRKLQKNESKTWENFALLNKCGLIDFIGLTPFKFLEFF